MPANANFSDSAVRQESTEFNADFRLLLSHLAGSQPETTSAYKSDKFTANPYTGEMTAEKFVGKFSGTLASEGEGLVAAHAAGTNNNKNTYVKIAQIKITKTNMDMPILIVCAGREYNVPAFLNIRFYNVGTIDPGLASFVFFGYANTRAFIYKSAASTWDVYVQKLVAYDGIAVLWYSAPSKGTGGVTLTLKNESLDTAISDWTQATKITL